MWKLPAALAALFCAGLLVVFPDMWNRTPVPAIVGEALYNLEVAREHAAFSASLLAATPATEIIVPVVGLETRDIADTYGEPRGTNRLHEGIDLFAPRGTYITSATPGIVARIGTNNLGGNIVFVLGPGGERYYYAHLDAIDPLLSVGEIVSTTTIVGTVGTTGNAEGTPPHLHFGIYGQGGAKNPYERLPQ